LFNGVKHVGVKQARIEIQAESDSLTIQVIDEGQGLDKHFLQRILRMN